MVKMVFHTRRPFRGRIFVRGMVEKSQCVSDFVNNTESSVNFELKNGDCNMRRQRKIGFPKGVEHSMTVVVSFHHTFLTQVDKAYRCTCFFMEADKILSSQVDVSMIPTVDLMDTPKSPVCSYNVRRGTLNGPLTTFANVGDKLWHVWKCDSGEQVDLAPDKRLKRNFTE
uniref:ZP domain-containing protein n=1 Tax=Romanomermis culicivorax TaxID=13658 RepID=A0A915IM15_ROMCU